MKKILISLIAIIIIAGCRKAQIVKTENTGPACPWTDTSSIHPKNAQFTALLEKYKRKGLPGISLLVKDSHGTWIGAVGKADLSNNIAFVPGTVSKAASITKLFIGTLVFKLMEVSANTGMGYGALNRKVKVT